MNTSIESIASQKHFARCIQEKKENLIKGEWNMDFLVQKGDVLFVKLPEEIDHYKTKMMVKEIDEVILSKEPSKVVFDFERTQFMDSSGIGLISGRYQKMMSLGGDVFLYNAKGHMDKILRMSGLSKIIGKYEETT